MKIEHLDDRMRVRLDGARGYAVIEIPDESDAPVAWLMDAPITREFRRYTHCITINNAEDGPHGPIAFPLTTAEAEELAKARAERLPVRRQTGGPAT